MSSTERATASATIRLDKNTDIPVDVYKEFELAGRLAKRRGQHYETRDVCAFVETRKLVTWLALEDKSPATTATTTASTPMVSTCSPGECNMRSEKRHATTPAAPAVMLDEEHQQRTERKHKTAFLPIRSRTVTLRYQHRHEEALKGKVDHKPPGEDFGTRLMRAARAILSYAPCTIRDRDDRVVPVEFDSDKDDCDGRAASKASQASTRLPSKESQASTRMASKESLASARMASMEPRVSNESQDMPAKVYRV